MEAAKVKLGEKLSVIWLEEFSPPQIELNPKLRLARADLWGWASPQCKPAQVPVL